MNGRLTGMTRAKMATSVAVAGWGCEMAWWKKKTLLEVYKNHNIFDVDGSICTTPEDCPDELFFVGLDDSKSCGRKVFHEEWNTVKTAREHIDAKMGG